MYKLIFFNIHSFLIRKINILLPIIFIIILAIIKITFNSNSGVISSLSGSLFFLRKSFFINILFFIFSITFITRVVNEVWKKPNETGLGSLIVEKPFTKMQLILGGLLSVGILTVGFSLVLFLSDNITIFLDSGKSIDLFIESLSRFFGTVLISFLFASLLFLISSFVSSTGLIYVSKFLAVVIPASSILISLVGEVELETANDYEYYLSTNNKTAENIYLDLSNIKSEYRQKNELKNRNNELYKSLVYIDPWYQLSGLYSIFSKKESSNINWVQDKRKIKSNLSINNIDYSLIFSKQSIQRGKVLNYKNIANSILLNNKRKSIIKQLTNKINKLKFEEQISLMDYLIEEGTRTLTKDDLLKEIKKSINIKYLRSTPESLYLLENMWNKKWFFKPTNTNLSKKQFDHQGSLSYLIKSSDSINIWKKDEYLNKIDLWIFWVLFSFIAFGSIIIIEYKKKRILS